MQQFLTQIGLKVDLQTVDFGVWLDKAKAGEILIYLFWDSCPVIPDNVLKQFTSESTINYIAYNDPGVRQNRGGSGGRKRSGKRKRSFTMKHRKISWIPAVSIR